MKSNDVLVELLLVLGGIKEVGEMLRHEAYTCCFNHRRTKHIFCSGNCTVAWVKYYLKLFFGGQSSIIVI